MNINGQIVIDADQLTVWQRLNDPDVLARCIPGCEQFEKLSDTEYRAVVKIRIGPVAARFKGRVILADLNPPNGCRISGEGEGGIAGFAKGGARVQLMQMNEMTQLNYDADALIGGKLAQLGQRLVAGAARKFTDEFFSKFGDVLKAPPVL